MEIYFRDALADVSELVPICHDVSSRLDAHRTQVYFNMKLA
jgi:hypothetical protein